MHNTLNCSECAEYSRKFNEVDRRWSNGRFPRNDRKSMSENYKGRRIYHEKETFRGPFPLFSEIQDVEVQRRIE